MGVKGAWLASMTESVRPMSLSAYAAREPEKSARLAVWLLGAGETIIWACILYVFAALLLVSAVPALAYVGPGAGISVLGSLLGILATIVVAIGAIIFWPIRKMMKKKKAAAAEDAVVEVAEEATDSKEQA